MFNGQYGTVVGQIAPVCPKFTHQFCVDRFFVSTLWNILTANQPKGAFVLSMKMKKRFQVWKTYLLDNINPAAIRLLFGRQSKYEIIEALNWENEHRN